MRVSVTGSNSAGSATASSAATAVVGALPSAPAPPATPYANNGFEGNIQTDVTTSPFYIARSDGGGFSSAYWQAVTGFSGQGLRLAVDSNLAYGSGNLGPLSFVGVDQGTAHTLPGESTWYRVRFKIPSSGFVGGYGEFQWLWEWHEQSPCDGNSTGFGLIDYHDGNPATGIGHMQLWFRPAGGNGNSPYYERWVLPYPSNVIQLDHWYDIVVNVVWDTKASNAGGRGAISVWVDGAVAPLRQIVNTSDGDGPAWTNPHPFPTLYTDGCSGAPDHPANGLYNYRRALSAGQASTIHFDDYTIGPTAASVGFTP